MSNQIRTEEVVRFLADPYQELAYHHGLVLTGLNFRSKEGSWLLVVKATFRLDGQKVAFIETEDIYHCLEYLATYCYRDNVPLRWSVDKYT